MKLAIANGNVYIQNTKEEYPIVKSLPNAKFDILNLIQRFIKLTPKIEAERQRLQKKQNKIDAERLNENPIPLATYPVKVNLFKHQLRGANMALIAMELLEE